MVLALLRIAHVELRRAREFTRVNPGSLGNSSEWAAGVEHEKNPDTEAMPNFPPEPNEYELAEGCPFRQTRPAQGSPAPEDTLLVFQTATKHMPYAPRFSNAL